MPNGKLGVKFHDTEHVVSERIIDSCKALQWQEYVDR